MQHRNWSLLKERCIQLGVRDIWSDLLSSENYITFIVERMRDQEMFIVKKSTIEGAGNGLFAKHEMAQGTLLGVESGKHINDKEQLLVEDNLEVDVQRYEKASKVGCNAEYILYRNVKTRHQWKLNIKLTRDVFKNEELFIHYFPEQWIVMQTYKKPSKVLEDYCIMAIGKSKIRAVMMWSLLQYFTNCTLNHR